MFTIDATTTTVPYYNKKITHRLNNKGLAAHDSNTGALFSKATAIMLFSVVAYIVYKTLTLGVSVVG